MYQNVGFGSKSDPYDVFIVPPHLLVVCVELFATCCVWGEFTWPQNAVVSSLEAAFIPVSRTLETAHVTVGLSVTCRNPG